MFDPKIAYTLISMAFIEYALIGFRFVIYYNCLWMGVETILKIKKIKPWN